MTSWYFCSLKQTMHLVVIKVIFLKMRPTELQWKNPKELTPAGYYPNTTWDGRKLGMRPLSSSFSATSFTTTKRFTQYGLAAQQTGKLVGPTSYKTNTTSMATMGGPVLRPYHKKPKGNYFYCGNHLVTHGGMRSLSRSRSRRVNRSKSRSKTSKDHRSASRIRIRQLLAKNDNK